MSMTCLDRNDRPYQAPVGALCIPCAACFLDKKTVKECSTEAKVYYVVYTTLTGAGVGAGIGAMVVPGAGAIPGVIIGTITGLSRGLYKVLD